MNRGFILPSGLTLYAGIGVLVLIGLMAIGLKVQTVRLASVKAEYALFVVETKAAGEAQNARSKQIEAKHVQIVKEKNDEIDIARSAHAVDVKRLRDKHSRFGLVPPAPPDSLKPNLTCFDRSEFSEALRSFTGEVGELIIKGESCAIELNNAREWAKALK